MEGREQVTIVRIAIEEMLEKTIDLWVARVYEDVCHPARVCVYALCVQKRSHTHIQMLRIEARKALSCDRYGERS